jgi:hypothetical protein
MIRGQHFHAALNVYNYGTGTVIPLNWGGWLRGASFNCARSFLRPLSTSVNSANISPTTDFRQTQTTIRWASSPKPERGSRSVCPSVLAWLVGWVIVGAAILAVIYATPRTRTRTSVARRTFDEQRSRHYRTHCDPGPALGLAARRGVRMTLEQWTVGGRGFGAPLVFLLTASYRYRWASQFGRGCARSPDSLVDALAPKAAAKWAREERKTRRSTTARSPMPRASASHEPNAAVSAIARTRRRFDRGRAWASAMGGKQPVAAKPGRRYLPPRLYPANPLNL